MGLFVGKIPSHFEPQVFFRYLLNPSSVSSYEKRPEKASCYRGNL